VVISSLSFKKMSPYLLNFIGDKVVELVHLHWANGILYFLQ